MDSGPLRSNPSPYGLSPSPTSGTSSSLRSNLSPSPYGLNPSLSPLESSRSPKSTDSSPLRLNPSPYGLSTSPTSRTSSPLRSNPSPSPYGLSSSPSLSHDSCTTSLPESCRSAAIMAGHLVNQCSNFCWSSPFLEQVAVTTKTTSSAIRREQKYRQLVGCSTIVSYEEGVNVSAGCRIVQHGHCSALEDRKFSKSTRVTGSPSR